MHFYIQELQNVFEMVPRIVIVSISNDSQIDMPYSMLNPSN